MTGNLLYHSILLVLLGGVDSGLIVLASPEPLKWAALFMKVFVQHRPYQRFRYLQCVTYTLSGYKRIIRLIGQGL